MYIYKNQIFLTIAMVAEKMPSTARRKGAASVNVDCRFAVAAACRMLYRNGCDSGIAGQVTGRIPGENAFFMTALEEYFDETVPSSVVDVALAGRTSSEGAVSPAADFHATLYSERPDVGAIVHIHSQWISVFCTLGRHVGQYNASAALFFDDQAIYEDDGIQASVDGQRMLAALDGRHVLWLKNHGAIVLADSVEAATTKAIALERVTLFDIEARRLGGTETARAEVLRAKQAYERSFLPAMWRANLRRLRRSDPDLFEAP